MKPEYFARHHLVGVLNAPFITFLTGVVARLNGRTPVQLYAPTFKPDGRIYRGVLRAKRFTHATGVVRALNRYTTRHP